MVHVNVGSPVGACSVGGTAFYRYVVRIADIGLTLRPQDRDATELLGAIPNAYHDEDEYAGDGWRVIPAATYEDWPVLEASPQRLRTAFETARRVIWENAAPAGITARDIDSIEEEMERVLAVIARAEDAGFRVNVSYVS